jgi:hypothetical protein
MIPPAHKPYTWSDRELGAKLGRVAGRGEFKILVRR